MIRAVGVLYWSLVELIPVIGMLASGCSADSTTSAQDPNSSLVIHPATVTLPPGGSETFVAFTQGSLASGVEWFASGGTITSGGLFTAPTETGSYRIQARYGGLTATATATVVAQDAPAALIAAASAACAAMPIRSTGTTRYFCDCAAGAQAGCVAGNDANAGTSAAAPKRSWGQAVSAFNAMNAGDTVALCRGGAWTTSAEATFANVRCSAAANMRTAANTTTCDLRDYSPSWGGTAKPIVRQTGSVNLLSFGDARQNGIRILNLDLEGNGTGPPGASDVGQRAISLGPNADFLICNNTINGWFLGIHQFPYTTPAPQRIDIWGNGFSLCSLDAYLGGGSGTTIDANYFEDTGAYSPTTHVLYPQGLNVTDFSIVNNEIRYVNRTCNGGIISGHEQFDRVNIENNNIDASNSTAGCWGIGMSGDDGYSTPQWNRNMTIRRNRITSRGWVAITCSNCPYAIVENNVIVSDAAAADSPLISIPRTAARTNPTDDITTNVQIRNNTIYATSAAASIRAIMVPNDDVGMGPEGSGYVIANNSVYLSNGGTCFVTGMPPGAFAFVGNNACYRGSWGTNYDNTTHVIADPLYTNPPTDFTPAAGSPLVGTGSATWSPTYDFTLRMRPSSPSIGAFER